MISLRQRVLWAGVLASAAFAASAQAPAQPATGTAAPQAQSEVAKSAKNPAERRANFEKRMERMKQHRTERMTALKGKLQLNASQDGAWSTYTAALQPPAMPKPDEFRARRDEFAKLTTPERIDRMQARQAERAAFATKRGEATKAFYAQLTPEQQKTFDAETLHMGRRGHGDRHHGGRHGQHPHGKPATAQQS